jgi:hypothetical protein
MSHLPALGLRAAEAAGVGAGAIAPAGDGPGPGPPHTNAATTGAGIHDGNDDGQVKLLPRHDQQQYQHQEFAVDSFNIHRLIISGITVASKFFSDVFYTNSRYAKVRFPFFFPSSSFCSLYLLLSVC